VDRYLSEMLVAAELVGIDPDDAPASEGELRDYLAGVTGLRLTPGAEEAMHMILFEPTGSGPAPARLVGHRGPA